MSDEIRVTIATGIGDILAPDIQIKAQSPVVNRNAGVAEQIAHLQLNVMKLVRSRC